MRGAQHAKSACWQAEIFLKLLRKEQWLGLLGGLPLPLQNLGCDLLCCSGQEIVCLPIQSKAIQLSGNVQASATQSTMHAVHSDLQLALA